MKDIRGEIPVDELVRRRRSQTPPQKFLDEEDIPPDLPPCVIPTAQKFQVFPVEVGPGAGKIGRKGREVPPEGRLTPRPLPFEEALKRPPGPDQGRRNPERGKGRHK